MEYKKSFIKRKGNAAFTLIELIVVIAIIAILAAIVIVNVVQYISKSSDAAAVADLANLQTAAANWYADNSSYDGFCVTSPDVANTRAAIDKLGSQYTFTCNDGTTTLTGYNYSNSWIPYALATSNNICAGMHTSFIMYVTKTTTSATIYSCMDILGLKTTSSINSNNVAGPWSSNAPSVCACN